jgi:hypothetical protein
MKEQKTQCKLCKKIFYNNNMSEEHYPARSVGNDDIVKLNIVKMMDYFSSDELYKRVEKRKLQGESLEQIYDDIFDN